MAIDPALVRQSEEQLATNQDQLTRKQEQMAQAVAALQAAAQDLNKQILALASPAPIKITRSVPIAFFGLATPDPCGKLIRLGSVGGPAHEAQCICFVWSGSGAAYRNGGADAFSRYSSRERQWQLKVL